MSIFTRRGKASTHRILCCTAICGSNEKRKKLGKRNDEVRDSDRDRRLHCDSGHHGAGLAFLTTLLGGTTRTERTQRGKVEGLLDELEQVSSRLQLEGDLAKKQGVDLALFHVRSRLT